EQSRAHSPAQQSIEDVGHVAPIVGDMQSGNPHADLHLLQRFLVARDNLGKRLRRGLLKAVLPGREVRELPPHELGEALVIEAAGSRYDHVSGIKEPAVIVEQHRLLEFADGFLCSKNWLAQRM